MDEESQTFYASMKKRRTIREFSSETVPLKVIENCILTAGTAPNGANRQPWHFVIVNDQAIKKEIRLAAEKEEQAFYSGRAPQEWLDALDHLGTDQNKPFLEAAPYLIAIFGKKKMRNEEGVLLKNYYVSESVGIATGMLITALHQSGLVTLTHTPSPMGFLNKILKRPNNEKPFLILVVGKPSKNATVPEITKKSLDEICSYI